MLKRQRGIADMWLLAIAGFALLAALGAVVWGTKAYIEGVDERAFARGKNETEAAYAVRDNKALTAVTAERDKLRAQVQKQERDFGIAIAVLTDEYEGKLQNAEKTRRNDVAAIRDGSLRLRDPGSTAAVTCPAVGPAGTATAASTGNAQAGGELSPELTQFLVGEANRADEIVEQLTLAQAVILQQVKLCGRSP